MAEQIVSPGVFTRENDLSFIQQGVGAIGAAVIGPFKQGPSFIPQIVNTQSEFEEKFGRVDGTFYTEQTVQNYLRESGTVTIVKVSGLGGYEQVSPFGIFTSGSNGRKLISSFHSTEQGDEGTGFTDNTFNYIVSSSLFTISGSDAGVDLTASVLPSDSNDILSVFGSSPVGGKNLYTYTYFRDLAASSEDELESGSFSLVEESLPTQDFNYDYQSAYTPWVESQEIAGERYELFRFHTLSDGNNTNTLYKVTIGNIRPAGSASGTDYSTFTVAIRAFDDTDKRPVVLETFNNVTLDPTSPNFIARVIGDRKISIDNDGRINESGDFPNISNYVRVEVKDDSLFPITVAPLGHSAYSNTVALNDHTEFPVATLSTGSASNTSTDQNTYSGFVFSGDNLQYTKPIPDNATFGSNVDFGLESVLDINDLSDPDADTRRTARAQAKFVLAFQGGFDGKSPAITNAKFENTNNNKFTSTNTQGFDLSTSTSSGTLAYQRALNAISNQDEYDINLLVLPGVVRDFHPTTFDLAVDVVERRGDAFFIGDLVSGDATITGVLDEATEVDSSYVGSYYPWVKTVDPNTNRQIAVPPSVLMPAVYAANDRLSAEWFAPAGLNRGGIQGAVGVLDRLSQGDRDDLYDGKVNPIASFPNQGIVAWGQKTLQDRPSALDRINVRRLLITSKKFIASTSRFLVFEQNTATTRNRFLNTVNPYFESIQQRQGLYAFRVVMDESNNTPDVVDRNILKGSIFLQPTRTAEFIVIDFNVLPTGATFDA